LDRYKYPKKTFFEFFFDFLNSLYRYTKGEKVVHFGFSTGTKIEFRLFEELKFNFSLLVPVLNPKNATFSHLVQSPQTIEEKNSKIIFFGYLYGSKYLIFGPKNFRKILELHLVPGTAFKNNFLKLR
jgi:hypothetical protein